MFVCVWVEVCRRGRVGRLVSVVDKKSVVVSVDNVSTCRIAFLMSLGSYSGFAVHEPVRR